jgi:hypothetical protein
MVTSRTKMSSSQLIDSEFYRFHNVTAPGNYLVVVELVKVVDSCVVLLYVCLCAMVVVAMRRPEALRNRVKRTALRLLLGNLMFSGMSFSWAWGMTIFVDYDSILCLYFGKLGGL